MGRGLAGVGVGVVVLIMVWAGAFMRRGSAGEEYRVLSHQIITKVDGYSVKPDYYDWLVDEGHDTVFNDSFKMESRSRRRVQTWVDEDQYMDDLFAWMITQATTDRATGVAAALEKYRSEHRTPEPEPKKKQGYR